MENVDQTEGRGRYRLFMLLIMALSAGLNLFRLNRVGINGFANTYYSAAVKAMLTSWHNFFYLSFDPAGFLALDKPPLTYWIQALSARIFGFNGVSLLMPQVLAGILSVWLLYRLVRRAYGEWAGLLAALALAVAPINVVTNRNNTGEALLLLVLLLAAWAVCRAVEAGSLRWLVVGAALVGLAFNVKMLQILLVLPALVALYFFGAPLPWRRRIAHLALALLVCIGVSLPWVLAVDLTPAENRPYVGGTTTNRVSELVWDYNGIARLWGENWNAALGEPGPLRLVGPKLAGQIGWLLPFALVGLLAAATSEVQIARDSRRDDRASPHFRSHPGDEGVARRLSDSEDRNLSRLPSPRGRRAGDEGAPGLNQTHGALILWGVWLMVQLVYFSVSTFYHAYYLSLMSPAIAALFGIGGVTLWKMWRAGGRQRIWGIVALVATIAAQVVPLLSHFAHGFWLIPTILAAAAAGCALIIFSERGHRRGRARVGAGVLIAALLVAPATWALIPVLTCTHPTLPGAGPPAFDCKPPDPRPFLDPNVVQYLEEHREGARFMGATYDLAVAALGFLESDEPFMALGGYRGSDPILTLDQFVERVEAGEVRYFLNMVGGDSSPAQEEIRAWVDAHCPAVDLESRSVILRGPCETKESS